jgi:hypothetical protein
MGAWTEPVDVRRTEECVVHGRCMVQCKCERWV